MRASKVFVRHLHSSPLYHPPLAYYDILQPSSLTTMHDQLVLHSHHTQRDPSANGHADSGSAGGAAQATTRSMRAGSCSSNATENSAATAGSSNYDTDGSSSASEASRKRKCDALDHHRQQKQHAASQPRTPGPMLGTAEESRSRSSSSSTMHLERVSIASPREHEQYRSSTATATTVTRVSPGGQPVTSMPSRRQYRQAPSLANRDGTDHPFSSLSVPPSPSPVAETSKRPRLAAVASTGHIRSTHATDVASGRDGSGALCLRACPSLLDITTRDDSDMPNGPPSASFSTLTITQPPSPAYAAFSVNLPTPPCLTNIQEGPSHNDRAHIPLAVSPYTSHTKLQPPRRSSFRSACPTGARRTDRHADRYTSARRRLRRAMSLPLEDEVTLSRRQLQRSHPLEQPEDSTLAFLPKPDTRSVDNMDVDPKSMSGTELHDNDSEMPMQGVQQPKSRLTTPKATLSPTMPENPLSTVQCEQSAEASLQSCCASPSHVSSASPANNRISPSIPPASSKSVSPPIPMSPTQLAALHRFNMP